MTGRLGNILFVSFSPDSQFLVSTTSYEIVVWDVGNRKMKYELLERHFFRSIGFSSSSKTFVAGDQLETYERQVTRYVISANCRHIPMEYSLYSYWSSSFCLVQVISVLFILN